MLVILANWEPGVGGSWLGETLLKIPLSFLFLSFSLSISLTKGEGVAEIQIKAVLRIASLTFMS